MVPRADMDRGRKSCPHWDLIPDYPVHSKTESHSDWKFIDAHCVPQFHLPPAPSIDSSCSRKQKLFKKILFTG